MVLKSSRTVLSLMLTNEKTSFRFILGFAQQIESFKNLKQTKPVHSQQMRTKLIFL